MWVLRYQLGDLARSFLSGSEQGTEGATEVGRVMGLYPDAACSTEAADEAFAAEDGGDPAFASLGELEGEGFLEGHNVSCVDDVVTVAINAVDGTKGVDDGFALSAHVDPEETFLGEEGFESLPVQSHIDALFAGDIGSALDDDLGAGFDFDLGHVSGQSSGEPDFASLVVGRVVVEEEGFSSDHSLETAKYAAGISLVGGGFHVDSVHGDHGAGFTGDDFTRGEGDFGGRGAGSVLDICFHQLFFLPEINRGVG